MLRDKGNNMKEPYKTQDYVYSKDAIKYIVLVLPSDLFKRTHRINFS